jgi:hypothetical protein
MGALTVALLAVLAALNSYSKASKLAASSPILMVRRRHRLDLRRPYRRFPKDAPLGYISDLALDQKAGVTAFLAAQYALAPHAVAPVDPSALTEWAVGNFALPGDYPAAGARLGYSVVADLGRGVLIFRRSPK